MLVQDVMSTGVVTARRNESVRSVVTKMLSRHCGAIPVVEDGELLIGMVTLRDVLIPLYPNYGEYIHDNVHSRDFVEMEEGYADVLTQRVEEVMSLNPLTVTPRTPVLEAASYMGLKIFAGFRWSRRGHWSGWSAWATSIEGSFSNEGMP